MLPILLITACVPTDAQGILPAQRNAYIHAINGNPDLTRWFKASATTAIAAASSASSSTALPPSPPAPPPDAPTLPRGLPHPPLE
eukprot:8099311-Alexandrium_andersonii.AAC.1